MAAVDEKTSSLHDVGRFAAMLIGGAAIGGFGYWLLSIQIKQDAYRSHLRRELRAGTSRTARPRESATPRTR